MVNIYKSLIAGLTPKSLNDPYRVLVIDDDPDMLFFIHNALKREHYEFYTTTNPIEALEYMIDDSMDIIIADNIMPEMTGTEFFSQLKVLFPNMIRIMIAGDKEVKTAMDCIDKGDIYRFIVKPFNATDLLITVRHGLIQRNLLRENHRLRKLVSLQADYLKAIEPAYPTHQKDEYEFLNDRLNNPLETP